MKLPKLVIADIDGTIRGRGVTNVGPKTVEALNKLHEAGVLIGIASGRPLWQRVKEHNKEWGLDFQFDFLVGMNGSEWVDTKTNELHHNYLLSKQSLEEIFNVMKGTNTNCFVYRDGYQVYQYADEHVQSSYNRHGTPFVLAKEESDLWEEETAKMLFWCGTQERRDELCVYAKEKQTDRFTAFTTGPELIEFQDPRVNKGVALRQICELYNIDLKDVVAFGDEEND
ncbi:MAG: HAD-IIB family hydrolase, partial [Erysipelotrichaceae bacterium]|nr:HAD-IIB family hydrolase [Erysipelotrichaceae bacterium]